MNVDMGESLKQARKRVGLTQKSAAEGICTQSMLSAIERGKYVPSATILLSLAKKLGINLDEFSLRENYDIGESAQINERMERLCNAHEYERLLRFLETVTVLDAIQTQAQTQAYYYYLGVARFQTQVSNAQASQALSMSLASAPSSRHGDTLSRLAVIAQGVIDAKAGRVAQAHEAVSTALHNLSASPYDENQNVMCYLAALISFEVGNEVAAARNCDDAIAFIASNGSHYMLANCYALLARVALLSEKNDEAVESKKRSQFLAQLFDEKVFSDF